VLGFLTSLARTYGDVACFRAGGRQVVLLNQPEAIKQVFLAPGGEFVKGLPLRMARRLVGEGLLTSEGTVHERHARIVQPAFRAAQVRSYGAVMTEYALSRFRGWEDGSTVDLYEELTRLATATAAKTLFDWEMDPEVEAGIDQALEDALRLFPWVGVPFLDLILKLPLPPVRRFHRAKAHLDAAIYRLIHARQAGTGDHNDLLSLLLAAQRESHNGDRWSDEQVRDEALTLFLTSFDTVSLGLTWTAYLIAQHAAVEATLLAELETVLAGRPPSVDDIPNLPYTRMVFAEGLRLYPPVYAIAREATTARAVAGFEIPAGTLFLMSPYVMQRDPRYFEAPESFEPSRWSANSGSRPQPFTYFPFGGGARSCVGQGYAWQEGILVLATLLQQWRLCLAPDHQVAVRPLINLRPKHGVRMVLQRRG
jgi:cytochrome P450